jgi:tetratricopeptide (TPR) repeat protein
VDSRDHERVAEIFVAAAKLSGDEREAFLKRACAGDAGLRAEVDSLLAHDDSSLAEQAGAAVVRELGDVAAIDEALPAAIGGYRVLGRIGHGGMGIVYEAEQLEPRRRVALKVVRPEFVTSASLRRFREEAQVLGWLDHPSIARIFEAGTDESGGRPRPFFAMELVEGLSLTAYCETKRLDIAARLALLAEVCDAVHHAHQKGVIHRDLKPANILVDASGRPKILDFGVARVTDSDLRTTTLRTQAGELVGTLPYMSPEQVQADPSLLDIRSDVYALGVVAYELLSGRLPLDLGERKVHEAARAIVEDEPSNLGALDPRLRGDVETIVARAIEKDRARRYASAEELASDMRRFLADEPIVARPASAIYQLRKFTRRNRVLVGGIVAVFATLVAGIVVSTRYGLGEARANTERGAALELADRRLREAERQSRIAREVNGFLTDGLLGAADPLRNADPEITLRRVVDGARPGLDGRFADEPLVRASILQTLGATYRSLGALDRAEACLDEALALHDATDDVDAFATAARWRLGIERGHVLYLAARWDEAAEQLVAVRERLLVDEDSELGDLLDATNLLALVHLAADEAATAEELARWSLAADPAVDGQMSDGHRSALRTFGHALARRGAFDEAETALSSMLADSERRFGPDHLQTQLDRGDLAAFYLNRQGRIDDAIALLEVSATVQRHSLGDTHPLTLPVLNNLAVAYWLAGRREESGALYREVLAATRARYGEENSRTLEARTALAGHLLDSGRTDEALDELLDVHALQVELLGPEHANAQDTASRLVVALTQVGDLTGASGVAFELLEVQERALAAGHPDLLATKFLLADLLERRNALEEAESYYLAAVEGGREHLPDDHLYRGLHPLRYAHCLSRMGRHDEAERTALEAHEFLVEHFGGEHPYAAEAKVLVGLIYDAAARPEAARAWREAQAQ